MSISKSTPGPSHLAILRAKGWTLRPAAKVAGVTATHLHQVLTGARHSRRLMAAIHALPNRHEAKP
jgi:lambda repressor-like predicted transcriptional regulator